MKIIVEGCDGSGKTTLAHSLAKIYDVPYVHYGPELDNYQLMMAEAGKLSDCIIDRYHISQMIYGPICRGEPSLTKEEQTDVEHQLGINNSVMILCDPGWNVTKDTWDREYLTPEQHYQVHQVYYGFGEVWNTEMMIGMWDFKKMKIIDLIREVDQHLW